MIIALVIILVIEVLSTYFMGGDAWVMTSVNQFEAAMLAAVACAGIKNPKVKSK